MKAKTHAIERADAHAENVWIQKLGAWASKVLRFDNGPSLQLSLESAVKTSNARYP